MPVALTMLITDLVERMALFRIGWTETNPAFFVEWHNIFAD